MTDSTEQPMVWAIRYTQMAINDIFAAWRHFHESAGEEIAEAWESGLKEEIAKLAQYPQRFSSESLAIFSLFQSVECFTEEPGAVRLIIFILACEPRLMMRRPC